MRFQLNKMALPLVATFAASGCTMDLPEDELAIGSDDEAIDDKADDGVDGAYTYFQLIADLRDCAGPTCGGWSLKRLNRTTTKCHDGERRESCYTTVLDWSESRLSDVQREKVIATAGEDAVSAGVHTIVRGRFAATEATDKPDMGGFVITEAWLAASKALSYGVFVRIRDNGVRCVAAPCPHLTETALNTSRTANIAAIDFTMSELDKYQIGAFERGTMQPEGILIVGYRNTVEQDGRTAKGRVATAAYEHLLPPWCGTEPTGTQDRER